MKTNKGLKITLIILLIILISIISFVGIYIQNKKSMINIVKDYALGMDLRGGRVISINVDKGTKTIYYDKDGNVVDTEQKDGKKEEVLINDESSLTTENYIKTKEIIEKRLNSIGIMEYDIRLDEQTGKIVVQIPENDSTDSVVQYIYTTASFTLEGENGEVLLDNSNIDRVRVGYSALETGTAVYLNIEFNKDCIDKLKEITNTYIATTDEEGNQTGKQVTLKIDDTTLMTTSFNKEITDGVLSITFGGATTNVETLNSNIRQASNVAVLLNNGRFPVNYEMDKNRYILSDFTSEDFGIVEIIVVALLLVCAIVLAFVYKKNGILVGIANIGYVALLLILVRYTNLFVTIDGIIGVFVTIVLSYCTSIYLLNKMQKATITYKDVMLKMLMVLIPALIIGITLCFANWMPIYSFGGTIFWGVLLTFIYHIVITRNLLTDSTKNK